MVKSLPSPKTDLDEAAGVCALMRNEGADCTCATVSLSPMFDTATSPNVTLRTPWMSSQLAGTGTGVRSAAGKVSWIWATWSYEAELLWAETTELMATRAVASSEDLEKAILTSKGQWKRVSKSKGRANEQVQEFCGWNRDADGGGGGEGKGEGGEGLRGSLMEAGTCWLSPLCDERKVPAPSPMHGQAAAQPEESVVGSSRSARKLPILGGSSSPALAQHWKQHAEPPSRVHWEFRLPLAQCAQMQWCCRPRKKFRASTARKSVGLKRRPTSQKKSRRVRLRFLSARRRHSSGSAWARQFARSLLPPQLRRQQEQCDQHKASKPASTPEPHSYNTMVVCSSCSPAVSMGSV